MPDDQHPFSLLNFIVAVRVLVCHPLPNVFRSLVRRFRPHRFSLLACPAPRNQGLVVADEIDRAGILLDATHARFVPHLDA